MSRQLSLACAPRIRGARRARGAWLSGCVPGALSGCVPSPPHLPPSAAVHPRPPLPPAQTKRVVAAGPHLRARHARQRARQLRQKPGVRGLRTRAPCMQRTCVCVHDQRLCMTHVQHACTRARTRRVRTRAPGAPGVRASLPGRLCFTSPCHPLPCKRALPHAHAPPLPPPVLALSAAPAHPALQPAAPTGSSLRYSAASAHVVSSSSVATSLRGGGGGVWV
jgi:hypothetical protein